MGNEWRYRNTFLYNLFVLAAAILPRIIDSSMPHRTCSRRYLPTTTLPADSSQFPLPVSFSASRDASSLNAKPIQPPSIIRNPSSPRFFHFSNRIVHDPLRLKIKIHLSLSLNIYIYIHTYMEDKRLEETRPDSTRSDPFPVNRGPGQLRCSFSHVKKTVATV